MVASLHFRRISHRLALAEGPSRRTAGQDPVTRSGPDGNSLDFTSESAASLLQPNEKRVIELLIGTRPLLVSIGYVLQRGQYVVIDRRNLHTYSHLYRQPSIPNQYKSERTVFWGR